jgi:hypothetical protein
VLLEKWEREVETSQRTFTVLVLPWKLDDAVATKLFRNFDGTVIHSIGFFENCEKCTFENDDHWNEYGNAKVAQFILSERRFPFHETFKNISFATREVDEFYKRRSR